MSPIISAEILKDLSHEYDGSLDCKYNADKINWLACTNTYIYHRPQYCRIPIHIQYNNLTYEQLSTVYTKAYLLILEHASKRNFNSQQSRS